MGDIVMISPNYRIARIVKKTRAKLFGEMREGDLIRFKSRLHHAGSASGGGVYATYITVENVTQGTSTTQSQSIITNILRNSFELELVEEAC